jgi:hypothetical protein
MSRVLSEESRVIVAAPGVVCVIRVEHLFDRSGFTARPEGCTHPVTDIESILSATGAVDRVVI